MQQADVVVIGAGTIGAMTLWQLSQRPGLRIIGLDAHPRVNLHASYAGESRLFRTAVKEGPVFNQHADTSIELWRALEQTSGRDILHQCGALSIGPADFGPMRTTQEVIDRYRLPHKRLTSGELAKRFPQFRHDPSDIGILDTRGGLLRSEVAVCAAQLAAEAHGAQLFFNTAVTGIAPSADGVNITTAAGEQFRADQVIVTTGSWTPGLLPEVASFIEVRPIGMTWAMPNNIENFRPEVFPIFMRDRLNADGSVTHWFGTPTLDGSSIKIGIYPEPWHTTLSPGEEPPGYTDDQLAYVGELVAECIPDLIASPVRHSVHHDSFASNQLPIFDRWPQDSRVLFATGMHGNAFKFAPSYGKMLAELAVKGHSALWRQEFSLASHDRLN